MSKKNKNRSKQAARISAKQHQEQNLTAAEQDAEKYGDVLFSATYFLDEKSADNAAALYGGGRTRDLCLVLLVVGIVMLVTNFVLGFNLAIFLIALVLAVSGATASGNWKSVTMWALMGTNLGDSKEDLNRHNVVTADEVIVEGPGAEVLRLPLHELRRVRHDEHGCLAMFGKARVAYFPASQMSVSRLRELEQFLEEAAR
ncbi:hypothetical protein [Parafannyhessea umbonata]|uniref:YcxB family protein n=1 Tax=Parafannyhessea umbonata TaxID=604330 RepID=A0A1H1NQM6_9ACTN|nr:hypothetical protein [Parafannyhessea umbonata]MCI6682009.1 hypothetical protein [Parafannyhessea umbonata]MCI7218028.1 hypothetical protein [Parafannyhessea umbonata]MDD6565379.1 hypothetical protein [Parafannyhessea umbonata]MDD6602260.1 hypothetical protein [Parafannyhessea umbonata]MDD7198365.1 hypothetical protein [Parafannyhessea umbonata]